MNIIIGIAFGLTEIQVCPFLKSLEQCGYKGKVLLFINNKSRINILRKFNVNVELVNVDEVYSRYSRFNRFLTKVLKATGLEFLWIDCHKKFILKRISRNMSLNNWLINVVYYNFHMNVSRFFFYYAWLSSNDFENVFLSDVSDVIFQNDIFLLQEKSIVVFQENEDVKIGDDINNTAWVYESYGKEISSKMRGYPIFCAGTIYCHQERCLAFMRDFLVEIISTKTPLKMNDQAVLNILISFKNKEYFSIKRNAEFVYTIATENFKNISVMDNMIVKKNCDSVPALIHQYNRNINLTNWVFEKYY